jgi:hypothetical protein
LIQYILNRIGDIYFVINNEYLFHLYCRAIPGQPS